MLLLLAQNRADLCHHPTDGAEVLVSVGCRWCSHADERQLRAQDGCRDVTRNLDAAGGDHGLHQLLDAFLHDGRVPRTNQVELVRIDVDPDYVVTVARQACQRDGTDVTQTEYTDSH